MMQHMGEDYDNQVIYHMLKHYGNLLDVQRSRFCAHTLPLLRRYIASSDYILDEYEKGLLSEIEGMGLKYDAVLNSLRQAQLKRFRDCSTEDSTHYAKEIEKIVKSGITTKDEEGVFSESINTQDDLVNEIIKNPREVDVTKINKKTVDAVQGILISSFEKFSLWCFQLQMGFKFQKQDFHSIVFDVCQKVIDGEIDRLIVTIPPRHSKTQILSIFLPLYSFCHNPGSQNIITSYADDVVQESSGYIRAIMTDPMFMKIFPKVRINPDKRSLERWGTTRQGTLHAVPTGGKLTGKGAGSLSPVYSGCFVVDDVIKPKDAYSGTVRSEINDRFDNTFMSRLANDGVIQDEEGNLIKCPRTPMCIIMQRVHDEDLVGYLLRGNSSDKYHYLNIPALVDKDTGSTEWYDRLIRKQGYTHAIPVIYDLKRDEESALWASRKSYETLKEMQAKTPYTYNSQYAGDPSAKGNGLINEEWFVEYDEIDLKTIVKTFITADTASTKESYSDYSVLIYWGVTKERMLVMLDAMVGKWEISPLKKEIEKFWKKHNTLNIRYPNLLPRALYMENKASGLYINQQFMKDASIRCIPVNRDRSGGDKVARFLNTVPYFAQGRIWFPRNHEHINHIRREITSFTSLGSGTGNDDVCDNVSDAVTIEFSGSSANYQNWVDD
ncbi:MAG: hypothetical protein EKE20_14655 [Candidatus Symbiopectobacterium sp. Dall1.0]|nr:hypothetical protein [Candidatus Symbiopectobacterium sp. Dall1.0]